MVAVHMVKCLIQGYPMPDNTLDNVSAPTKVGSTGTGIFSNLFIQVLTNLQNKILEKEDFKPLLAAFPCWCTTTYAISNSLPLKPAMFDVVIIDESSQCNVLSLPILMRGKKVVRQAEVLQCFCLSAIK